MKRRTSFGERDESRLYAVREDDRDAFLDQHHFVDLVTPAQWFGGRASSETPERTFLRVVLASGLHELARFAPGTEAHEAAREWLLADDDLGNLCSFRSLCDVFDLDHEAVRAAVLERLAARTLRIPREPRVQDSQPKRIKAKAA